MPSRNTADISHEQVTDHDIESRPANHGADASVGPTHDELVPVGIFPAGDREYGLAYAQLAQRGLPGASESALRLLTKAAQSGASDEELNVRLGYLNQVAGNTEKAGAFYAKTLEANPYEPTALANLAVIDASSNHLPEAVRLLQRLAASDPSQTAAGVNLAFVLCRVDKPDDALSVLRKLELINPDDPQLRNFLHSGNYGGQHCSLPPSDGAQH
jgi:tetratricopeptide (TPR) repeat protein